MTEAPRYETLSADQRAAFDAIMRWVAEGTEPYLTLGGLAGTGKSTIAAVLANRLRERSIVFTAFTGKATDVLSRKLAAYDIDAPCATLHSLMYKPLKDERDRVIGWEKKAVLDDNPELVVVDEASMLGVDLWTDLQSYGVPILAIGDHGQLPPVGAGTLSLLDSPHLRLEKIHRQAEGNPILKLAHHVRAGGDLRSHFAGPRTTADGLSGIFEVPYMEHVVDYLAWDFDAVGICYFNVTRCRINELVRQRRGYLGPDVVICLRNDKHIRVFNGMRGILTHIDPPDERGRARAQLSFPDHGLQISARLQVAQFGRPHTIKEITDEFAWAFRLSEIGLLFDYGYCLTCHKSQGSQWRTVIVKPEYRWEDSADYRARWTYTAVTRASERLVIAG